VAREGHVEPGVILTKADLCEDSNEFVKSAQAIAGSAPGVALDATSASAVQRRNAQRQRRKERGRE